MRKKEIGVVKDWLWPVIIGIALTVVALFLSDFFSSNLESQHSFETLFFPLVFTYATTMLGLSLTCYTLFQTLDNDMVKRIRKWELYTRFKMYIWHIMIILTVLAILTLIELFAFEKLLYWINAWILFGVPLFLSVLTLSALLYWIRLLIKDYTAENGMNG